jgi:hypothetical protein
MPKIRVYARELPMEEKNAIARELVSIACSAFQLRAEERSRVMVQFLPRFSAESRYAPDAAVLVEVSGDRLSGSRMSEFVDAARAMLFESPAVKPLSRIGRWFGIEANPARQIAFQFEDTRVQQEYVFGDRFAAIVARRVA